jgi:predicted ATPase
MFTRIETRQYRSLRSVTQRLGRFHALVGPNASGKTTFLDVIGFLGDLVRSGGKVVETVRARSSNFEALLWRGEGSSFQMAVDAAIPENIRQNMSPGNKRFGQVRYEIGVGFDFNTQEIGLYHEALWLTVARHDIPVQRDLFPEVRRKPPALFLQSGSGRKLAISHDPAKNAKFYPDGKQTYNPTFRIGPQAAAIANIPADEESFVAPLWFRDLLASGIQNFTLNSQVIRQPSPPGMGRRFQPDGSNLPHVINELRSDQQRFRQWIEHVQTALPDIVDVDTVERPEDKHRYLLVKYMNGAHVPSWLVSDGTLRLLALTIPAYLSGFEGVFLIEEPENGIHPKAIETVLQSLSSIYDSQVLLATHSPVALNMLEASEVLCFAKDSEGATDIISGDQHPALRRWKEGAPELGILFASGVLG